MQRFVVLALVAGCGAQLGDDDMQPSPPDAVAAVCDDAKLPAELAALPGITRVQETACGENVKTGARCFKVYFRQPLSASNPRTFDQQLLLAHRGCNRPVVVADWGYSSFGFFDDELATLFHANTLWLEHRFQGESVPATNDWDWTALTIENGAADTHHVIDAFKRVYGGNWVSTGASKGGITATYHAYFWPKDLAGSIPYVAPASRARIDDAYQQYVAQHMTSTCAQGIHNTQLAAVTTRKSAMLSRLTPIVGAGNEETYLESMAGYLEWSFWQFYGNTSCPAVPTSATSDDDFFSFLKQASGYPERLPATDARSDGALSYEWLTEQGFAQQLSPSLASYVTDPGATMTMEQTFAQQYPGIPLPAYNGQVTREVRTWVQSRATNLMLIYGELDPWSGGALEPPTGANTGRYFVPGANHGAQITALTSERSAALALAAKLFGEQPDLTAMPRAIEAGQTRNEILARAYASEAGNRMR